MSPSYDEYLPGPVAVLVEWLFLLISTLMTYFDRKKAADAETTQGE